MGDIVVLTRTNGRIDAAHNYDAFGNVAAQSGHLAYNRLVNTRAALTRPYFHGAAIYDAAIGCYISRDPAGFLDGPSLYVYLGNNAVNRIDPTGLSEWGDLGDLVASAG